MESLSSEEKQEEEICLPPSVIDPKGLKLGQHISCKVSGKIKNIDEKYGVRITLGKKEDDLDEFESLSDDGQKKKIKEQMETMNNET